MRPFGILALVTALVFALVPAPFASADPEAPSVSISGTIVTGQPLDAVVSGIEGEIAYEWRIDGVPTRLESWPTGYPVPPDRFFLYEEFLGKQLSVSATVAPTTGEPVVLTSASHTIEQGGFLANRPTVTGELRVGQTLTASHNILYPTEGVSITYQWLLWQMPIPGATGATLTLLPEHVGLQNVRVEVTAAKDGWPTDVRKSQALHGEVIPERLEPGRVRLDRPVARETVTFHEDWGPGEDLVTVSIQWLLDGRELPGMTAPTITVDPAWVGAKLAVRVTKQRRDGSAAVAVTSEAHEVMGQTITGWGRLVGRQAVVGWPLSYEPVSIPPGVTQKVQWVRVDAQGRETPITGVQGRHYRVTAADIGYRVGVRYTLSGPGYTTVSAVNLTPNATPLNVYTTPGRHTVNGREWRTSCEPYSQTIRCRTEIWATQVKRENHRYTRVTGWAFNNLTYMPLTTGTWGANPLARDVQWTDDAGRQWKTECLRESTCRTYIWQSVPTAYQSGGTWRYTDINQWVFNNMVYIG